VSDIPTRLSLWLRDLGSHLAAGHPGPAHWRWRASTIVKPLRRRLFP
jgi:hypothetical protein